MKTLHLSIIIVLMLIGVLVVPSAQTAKAIPYFSPQELYNLSDMVFYGEVLTKGPGPGPDYYYYQVQVITYFKNQQTSDTITVAGHKPGDPRAPYPQFEVGDNAVFYIRKTDGINTIYWNSQKAGNACNMQSFLESSPISANPKIGPAPSTHIYIEDAKGIMPYIPLTNHTAVFHDDDVWNNYPESRTVPVTLSIRDQDDGQQVFNQTQTLEMQACSGPGKVQWNFVPTQIANYVATVTDDKSKISEIFNSIYNSAADSQIILSPLKQLKSGIKLEDIVCRHNLMLLVSYDGNPACVKSASVEKLVGLGWKVINVDPKFSRMSVQVSGSYAPLTLEGHFLKGSLHSRQGPISNGTVSISVNGVPMGNAVTYPDGCFQFDNWDEQKFSNKIDEFVAQDRMQIEHSPKSLLFSARYAGDLDHYPASAQVSSYLYLGVPPIMPAMYETTPTSIVENLTQGDTTQFQIMIKPILRQSEIQHPNLILQPTPCGLDYDIKPAGTDTITQNNENKFDVTLKTSDYVPPGKYFVIIYNNLSQPGYPEQYMDEIAGFVLNVVQK